MTVDIAKNAAVAYYERVTRLRRIVVIANLAVAAVTTSGILYAEWLWTNGLQPKATNQKVWLIGMSIMAACALVQAVFDLWAGNFAFQQRRRLRGFSVIIPKEDND